MYTCPYCATSYREFISNCSNCGGPLDPPETWRRYRDEAQPMTPPLPPRPISGAYAWKLFWADAKGIVSAIFLILGVTFTVVGASLTVPVITAFVGLPFLLIGMIFLAVSGPMVVQRYNEARKTVQVLREGDSTIGEITSVEQNMTVRVNHQHPWTIHYLYQVFGKNYEGSVSTLITPGPQLTAGRSASILYLPSSPENSTLYPHP